MNFDRRQSRRRCFIIFKSLAKDIFEKLSISDPHHLARKNVFSFYIVPNGSDGGNNERLVDIFYGHRPFEKVIEAIPDNSGLPRMRQKLLTEYGAMLRYERTSSGLVLCILYPCRAEDITPYEDFIILEKGIEPEKLTGELVLKKHWKIFSSFSEVRSIDGNPSMLDKVRVSWALFTKLTCIDGKVQELRVITVVKKIMYFVFTVGLSGFLLSLIRMLFEKPEEVLQVNNLYLLLR